METKSSEIWSDQYVGLLVPVVVETQAYSWHSCYLLWAKLILRIMPLRKGLDPVINLTPCVPQHAHTCICMERHEIKTQVVWYERKINLWWNCFREQACFTASHPSPGWLFLLWLILQPLQSMHDCKIKKMGMVYCLEWKQRRGREIEEKEAEDGSNELADVCVLPNGTSTLHPTAL